MLETRIAAPELRSCPPGPRQTRSDQGRRGRARRARVEEGPELRVAVLGSLHGLGVEAEGDVVDEHAAVDLGEVDAPLAAVDERVEGADDVVAIDPEVEREVVAGARRDAGVREVELGRDRGDDRLRAVPAGHRQAVGAASHRVADQRLEIVAAGSSTGSMSRARASSATWNRSALPPPDLGL